jgi:tetratricopeptide (TPR) repeat protein
VVLKNSPAGDGENPAPPSPDGDREPFHVYRITKVADGWRWLKLEAEDDDAAGWARAEDVIPYRRAIDYYTAEIAMHPASGLYNNRGNLWRDQGTLDNAISDFNAAIRLDPANAAAYCNRGGALSDKKDFDQAIADFDAALKIDTNFATAYLGRGLVWESKHDYGKALADFNAAVRLQPRSAPAQNTRAWLLATCPSAEIRDGKQAVDSAARACELSHFRSPAMIDTLAAAYAEAGDFDQAVQWQEAALAQLPTDDVPDRQDFGSRLTLYRQAKPYREEPGAR